MDSFVNSVISEPLINEQLISEPLNGETTKVRPLDGSDDERRILVWQEVRTQIRQVVSSFSFNAYIDPLYLLRLDEAAGEATVAAPSKLIKTNVEASFGEKIRDLLGQVLSISTIKLDFLVIANDIDQTPIVIHRQALVEKPSESHGWNEKGNSSGAMARAQYSENAPRKGRPGDSGDSFTTNLNSRYTFESFVVGNSNQFCHAAAQRVAERPGESYNPLFIYGGVGLGKTHLLHAIGNAVLSSRPKARIFYLSSETFTNELILALRHAKMDDFKNRFRSIDVLLVDDIQFMCGKERTQEEFFHTFNALYNLKHQIVITSDKVPQEIPGIEERLQTRFSWGLTADLQAPDFETRVAILKRKAQQELFDLPHDAANYIAERVSSNVRELEGALNRLHAICSIKGSAVTLLHLEEAMRPLMSVKRTQLSVDTIKNAVAQFFNLKTAEIISKRRTKNLSFPRHIAMYLCRKHTTCSYPDIGGQFGGRDHSSVIHAATVVTSKMKSDSKVRSIVEEIEKCLFL